MPRSANKQPHPVTRFSAPSSIEHGKALKLVFGERLVALIAESLAQVYPPFDSQSFCRLAGEGLQSLELKKRTEHIAQAMISHLPSNFNRLAKILIKSLGPELTATGGNGLAPFFYWPHAHVIATTGIEHFELGMQANYELTKRFTAEFSIRPFLIQHQSDCLALLAQWSHDPNPHVRRLVSEGTRPRLPWAMRLPNIQRDPDLTLPLLEQLKDDPELYVRRSVANHIGDILKDNPEIGYRVCQRWLDELHAPHMPPDIVDGRKWLIRHAVRLPAKKSEPRALKLRQLAQ